jgi:hypothetical protein
MSLTISYIFLHVQHHVQISQGLSIDVSISYTFYMHNAAYKSKGLLIDALYNFYYFQHTHRHIQEARDSIGMCSKFSI